MDNQSENNFEIIQLKEENEQLKKKIVELEERLKSYNCSERYKKYYEKNTDKVKERNKNYTQKLKETDPEKLKEWRHNAYIKRKQKMKSVTENVKE